MTLGVCSDLGFSGPQSVGCLGRRGFRFRLLTDPEPPPKSVLTEAESFLIVA